MRQPTILVLLCTLFLAASNLEPHHVAKLRSTKDHALFFALPAGMVLVPGGTFEMGDVMGDKEYDDETVHTVTVSSFLLAKNELTFDEYDAFCKATGRELPSDSGLGRGKRPVINVDWYDAVEYCNWRSTQEGVQVVYSINKNTKDSNNSSTSDTKKWQVTTSRSANGYRLPTEAEWEYAARTGGKKVRFGNGKILPILKKLILTLFLAKRSPTLLPENTARKHFQ